MTGISHLLTIGIASNLDNLAVGVAYGIRRISLPARSNLAIAGIAFIFSVVAASAGSLLGHHLTDRVAAVTGAVLLIGIGIWAMPKPEKNGKRGRDPEKGQPEPIAERGPAEMERAPAGQADPAVCAAAGPARRPSVWGVLRNPELADRDHSGEISASESLVLGIAVSLNCLTNGVSAGLWKLGPVATGVTNGALSYLTLWAGVRLGLRYGGHWLGRKAALIAAVLLILLGLEQLL